MGFEIYQHKISDVSHHHVLKLSLENIAINQFIVIIVLGNPIFPGSMNYYEWNRINKSYNMT